jgi:hypothetical protein
MQTATTLAARVLARAAATAALACVASFAAGCSPSAKAPVSQPLQVSGVASSTASTATAQSTTASVSATKTTPTKTVDCAGGAVSSTLTVGATSSKPQIGSIPRPSDTAAIAGAKKVLLEIEGATLASAKVVSMTQDKKGVWWVLLATIDKESGPAQAVVSFDGKKWEENVYGLEVNDEDLPPDVRF